MLERVLSLGWEAKLLGSRLFAVKEKVISDVGYGTYLASEKVDKVVDNCKVKVDEAKVKMEEEKAKRAEAKAKKLEEKKAKKEEKKLESKEPVKTVATITPVKEEVEKVEAEIIVEEPVTLTKGVTYAPDFSGLENVTIPLESEITETVENPVIVEETKSEVESDKKEVTQEDLDKALNKIKNNMIKS